MSNTKEEAKRHLRAVAKEYLILDERLPEDKILDMLIDAVTKPTSDQPIVLQQHIKGTRAYKLYRTPTNEMTEDDRRFLDGVDDFRMRDL